MKLEEKLVILRKQRKLSQDELANALGVSRQAVQKWERGAGMPSAENLKYLSERLGVTADFLLSDDASLPLPPEEPTRSRKWNWKLIAAIAVAVLMAVLIYMGTSKNDEPPVFPIEELQGEQVVIAPEGEFDFKE